MNTRIQHWRKSVSATAILLAMGAVGTAVPGAALAAEAAQSMPGMEQMWALIQQQQQQIAALQKALKAQAAPASNPASAGAVTARPASAAAQPALEELSQRIDAQNAKIEATSGLLEDALQEGGMGGQGWWNKTSIGGYGEMHYNGGKKDELDFHRFVLFAGHHFNDWLRFASELEVEHVIASSDPDDGGEVELEQAFVEMDLTRGAGLRFGASDSHALKAGIFLVPVGILNDTHEPPTFYGVERNQVEKNIIPTTWFVGGADLNGRFGKRFSYDLAVHEGLDVDSSFSIRGGRQEVSEASAKDPGLTARLRWTAMPGVRFSVTGQIQGDITQGRQNIGANLLEGHAIIERGGFGLRALYARWHLDRAAQVVALGRDRQYGWYVEPSYKFGTKAGDIGVFGRHEAWNTQAGLKAAGTRFAATTVGLNYWPHPDVVFKVDYQFDNPPAGVADDDRINLGVGYQF